MREYNIVLQMFTDYSKFGTYPNEGGLVNQSVKILEAFKVINNTLNEIKSLDSQ